MRDFDKLRRERERFALQHQKLLTDYIKRLQSELYLQLLERVVTVLETDAKGKLKLSVKNIRQADNIQLVVRQFNQSENKGLLSWVFDKLIGLFGANKRYFKSFTDHAEETDERIQRLTMLRYGFDTTNDSLVPGGYLSALASSDSVGIEVARFILSNLGTASQSQFKKDFKTLFLGTGKIGLLERYYDRFTHNLFMEFDRETGLAYADELGLPCAIYSGTAKDNSRDFCLSRLRRIYTRKEIDSWNKLTWSGKTPGVDVKIACGGRRCRHSLDWITMELARQLVEQYGEIDGYNVI